MSTKANRLELCKSFIREELETMLSAESYYESQIEKAFARLDKPHRNVYGVAMEIFSFLIAELSNPANHDTATV